jgi:hypothetical protein
MIRPPVTIRFAAMSRVDPQQHQPAVVYVETQRQIAERLHYVNREDVTGAVQRAVGVAIGAGAALTAAMAIAPVTTGTAITLAVATAAASPRAVASAASFVGGIPTWRVPYLSGAAEAISSAAELAAFLILCELPVTRAIALPQSAARRALTAEQMRNAAPADPEPALRRSQRLLAENQPAKKRNAPPIADRRAPLKRARMS